MSHWKKRRFCSLKCARKGQRRTSGKAYWKPDATSASTGRNRARRLYPDAQPCDKCGAEGAERHHRDGNPLNNEPENIVWLCRKHHIATDRRNAQKRKPMTPERLERRRRLARERQRRHRARQKAA